jgi:hypothetical protein
MNALMPRLVAITLVAFVSSTLLSAVAQAGIISTASGLDRAVADARNANVAKVETQLARAEVQSRLMGFGVTPEQVQARVAALSDREVADLAKRIDQAPAGADGGVFAVIGIVFVVLLILDYVGAIHIFTHRR